MDHTLAVRSSPATRSQFTYSLSLVTLSGSGCVGWGIKNSGAYDPIARNLNGGFGNILGDIFGRP